MPVEISGNIKRKICFLFFQKLIFLDKNKSIAQIFIACKISFMFTLDIKAFILLNFMYYQNIPSLILSCFISQTKELTPY